ncbi:hypothetical protein N1495_01320 [Streptococcus didelphis]|uniref:Uncharacterized protein n=1 Tax=Streptococcus didelphis TaxID=102886 RepID=A0ABY9LG74_9STRE|nr:hypothetical protein [Streptococcus didelphis]WMB27850.1 hypothetical protein N1496_07290 [Streptococcus didelphis]WMB29688.1 hypothetical protein N1495_01320 [Streptococcus didelphis]
MAKVLVKKRWLDLPVTDDKLSELGLKEISLNDLITPVVKFFDKTYENVALTLAEVNELYSICQSSQVTEKQFEAFNYCYGLKKYYLLENVTFYKSKEDYVNIIFENDDCLKVADNGIVLEII